MYVARNAICAFIVLIVVLQTVCFNIDTKSAFVVENNNGMFGFSVALHRSNSGGYVIVGSPNGDNKVKGLDDAGVVFKCPIDGESDEINNCNDMIDVFNDGPNRVVEGELVENKSGQFLGVSVESVDDYIVACAHRYTNIVRPNQEIDPVYQLIGRCLVADQDFKKKFDHDLKPCDNGKDRGYHSYGLCQAGLSLSLQKSKVDGEYFSWVSIGAPGLGQGTGGGWEYNLLRLNSKSDVDYEIPAEVVKDSKTKVQYRGYSSIICNMNNDEYYGDVTVISGPRADMYKGQVFIYTRTDEGTYMALHTYLTPGFDFILDGEQFGSYFGHSLACSDVNGDGYKDLIVGAPWFTDYSNRGSAKPDTGRIYIYHGSLYLEEISLLENPQTITGDQPNGAFGFSMTSAGDTNKDGYEDLFVGAPYFNDNEGAVFLYLGSEVGLQSSYSQLISPTSLNVNVENMLTFGWSISAGKDMDNNGHPDVAIGAYKSGHVVFLRSTAIIDVVPRFVLSSDRINPNNATLNVSLKNGSTIRVAGTKLQICLEYNGERSNNTIEVEVTVTLDTKISSSRVYFDYDAPKSTWTTSLPIDLNATDTICSSQKNIYLYNGIEDVRPVEVEVAANLATTAETFSARKVLNQKIIRETKAIIAIITKCNQESGKCNVDLKMEIPDYSFENDNLYPAVVLDKVSFVHPLVVITNTFKGLYNYTYSPIVRLQLPEHLKYESVTSNSQEKVSCETIDNMLLECKVPTTGPLNDPNNPKQEFILDLKIVNVTSTMNLRINGSVYASEPSVENNDSDNDAEVVIKVKELADMTIRGGATQSKLSFNNKYTLINDIIGSEELKLRHFFRIDMNEESERTYIEDIKLDVFWPMKTHGKDGRFVLPIIEVAMPEGDTLKRGAICEPTVEKLYASTGSHTEKIVDSKQRIGSGNIMTVNNDTLYLVDTAAVKDSEQLPSMEEVVTIDCSLDREKCIKLSCNIERIQVSQTKDAIGGFKMSIVARVHEANLYGVEKLTVTSFAEIVSVGGDLVIPLRSSLSSTTELYASVTKSHNLWWYIVGGIIGGLLLLLFIIFVLWKLGFFKRKQPPTITADKVDEQLEFE